MRQVVGHLPLTSALGFADGLAHRIGDLVGVKDGLAVQVARRPADRLDEAAFRAQEAFLVGVQDRHQGHLRNVQPLAQEVDAHQHVKSAKPQIPDDLHAFHRVDVTVQVPHLDAVFGQVVGQLLGHALGQRGDEHALLHLDTIADLLQHIVHLVHSWAHLDHRVHQPRGPHQLLHHLACMGLLVSRWRGRDKDGLPHLGLELLELQGPVVQRAGQPKAVLHQRGLAGAVAVEHAAELSDQHVTLVQEHQRVARQVIHQRGWRVSRPCAGKVTGVVLDALAVAHLLQHLQIEPGALLQALRLHQLAGLDELVQPFTQLQLDGLDGGHHTVARGDVVAARVDREAWNLLPDAPRQRVEQLQRLHLVIEELDADRQLAVLGRKHVDRVTPHTEGAA